MLNNTIKKLKNIDYSKLPERVEKRFILPLLFKLPEQVEKRLIFTGEKNEY